METPGDIGQLEATVIAETISEMPYNIKYACNVAAGKLIAKGQRYICSQDELELYFYHYWYNHKQWFYQTFGELFKLVPNTPPNRKNIKRSLL